MNIDIKKPIEVSTEDFLKAFGYTTSDEVFIRCFHDKDKDKKALNLQAHIRALNGLENTLRSKNADAYGIYFVVNGSGHTDKEVLKGKIARAQFMEIDDRPFNEQIDAISNFPLEPSIIVKTRKSLHTYWLLKDGDIKQFRDIQERLIAYFHSDEAIKNESRVMRLPNYNHCKKEPVKVEVLKFDADIRYTQDELKSILPQVNYKADPAYREPTTERTGDTLQEQAGGRHNAIMRQGGLLRRTDASDEEIRAALYAINQTFTEPLEERELNKYIGDILDYKAEDAQAEEQIEAAEIEAYKQDTAGNRLHILDEYIAAQDLYKAIPTGFTDFDKILGGGVRNGLYIIGAISSLGKTTFVLQIADNIAKQGTDILFYSLEMSEREIMAKSLSRESLEVSLDTTGNSETAKTTLQILTGKRDARTGTPYTEDDIATLQRARDIYTEYAGHIRIIEGVGDIDVKRIEADAERHKAITGNTPVVVIDYLQILARYDAENDRRNYTDKQVIDKNILELKRLSRKFPIIAISSFNRESYTEPVNLSSFKESGAVEYTSDLLIGLQYAGMDYEDEKDTEHRKRVKELLRTQEANGRQGKAQDIQVKILKNRNGYRGDIALQFYPMFNTFRGIGEATGADNPFIQNEAKNGLDNKQRKVLEPI